MGALIVVGVCVDWKRGGEVLSCVRGLCFDGICRVVRRYGQGKRLYGDKEKSKPFIEQQQTTLAEVNYFGLDSVAKVVEHFRKAHGKGDFFCFLLNIIEGYGALPEDFFSPIFPFSFI